MAQFRFKSDFLFRELLQVQARCKGIWLKDDSGDGRVGDGLNCVWQLPSKEHYCLWIARKGSWPFSATFIYDTSSSGPRMDTFTQTDWTKEMERNGSNNGNGNSNVSTQLILSSTIHPLGDLNPLVIPDQFSCVSHS